MTGGHEKERFGVTTKNPLVLAVNGASRGVIWSPSA